MGKVEFRKAPQTIYVVQVTSIFNGKPYFQSSAYLTRKSFEAEVARVRKHPKQYVDIQTIIYTPTHVEVP